MKSKIFKIIFWLSIIFYGVLILISVYYAIAGYTYESYLYGSKTSYGTEAFFYSLRENGSTLTASVPVIQIVAAYQVIYIIVAIVKKEEQERGKVFKIIFILSLIFYLVLILISLYFAIFGYDYYAMVSGIHSRLYGAAAFTESLFEICLRLILVVPVIPVVIIYQIIYIVAIVVKNFKQEISEEIDKNNKRKNKN